MAPSGGQRVDAQGRVTYEFEGVVHAEGLDLASGSGFAEPFNQIRWLREADGAVVADLYAFHDPAGDGPGAPHTANVILEALGDDNVANLELAALNETSGVLTTARFRASAIGSGAGPRRVLSVALEPELIGAPDSATILDSQGRSSFIRRADGASAGAHRGTFGAAAWPPASPQNRDRATLVWNSPTSGWIRWEFEFDANLGGWNFVGGPPAYSEVVAGQTNGATTGAWMDLATLGPDITTPIAGNYVLSYGGRHTAPAAGAASMVFGVSIAGGVPLVDSHVHASSYAASITQAGYRPAWFVGGLAKNTLLRLRYFFGSANANADNRILSILPTFVT